MHVSCHCMTWPVVYGICIGLHPVLLAKILHARKSIAPAS